MVDIPAEGWVADDLTRFRRYLCMGSEMGAYTSSDREPTRKDLIAMKNLIEAGRGNEVLAEIVAFSADGRAAKSKPVIYALAVCVKDTDITDTRLKQSAYGKLGDVLRIPTHLFQFLFYCHRIVQECSDNKKKPMGWGRSSRAAVSRWYNEKDTMTLAMHVSKYIQRHKWSHRDILRMAHVKPKDKAMAFVLRYAAKGFKAIEESASKSELSKEEQDVFDYLKAVHELKHSKLGEEEQAALLIDSHNLLREHVPTWMYNSKPVWESLLRHMPLQAMVRNLGKMSSIGLFNATAANGCTELVLSRLNDKQLIQNSRIHPFHFLVAHQTYKVGKGDKGKLKWEVNGSIVNVLMQAFYTSFSNLQPTNKRFLLAIDVSPSMEYGDVSSMPRVTSATAAAAMAMMICRTHTPTTPEAAAPSVLGYSVHKEGNLRPINITPEQELEDVMKTIQDLPMGDVDAAKPIQWAEENKKPVDVFLVLTDCHTQPGAEPPAKALSRYRKNMGINDARLIVVAMTANKFTLADPKDPLMLDIAGFDLNVPALINNFINDVFKPTEGTKNDK